MARDIFSLPGVMAAVRTISEVEEDRYSEVPG